MASGYGEREKNMNQPLVSIIVPIYKVEPYLRHCLDSLVNQTYTNLKIILIDDGSPDNCPQICDEYAAKDNRIVVIHKENGGLSDARNAGLEICKGEYISFVDSDDWVDDIYIETLCSQIRDNQYDFIIADYYQSNESAEAKHILCDNGSILGNTPIISTYCKLTYPPCAWAKLYNRLFIEKYHFRFYPKLLFEDQLWNCQLAAKAKNIYITNFKIYHYIIRNNSIMQSKDITFTNRILSWKHILATEKKLLKPYQKTLSNEINFFFVNKITEVFTISIHDRILFNTAFYAIKDALGTNPITYWFANAHGLKKIILFFLTKVSSIYSQWILYFYLKKQYEFSNLHNRSHIQSRTISATLFGQHRQSDLYKS